MTLKDALRLSQCCWRLASFRDYNHDPRLDDQAGIINACKLGLWEVVSLMMNVAHVDLNTCLLEGCANGQLGIVKLLIRNKHLLNAGTFYADFWEAIKEGHSDVVQEMIHSGLVDPSQENNWAIRWAARYGKISLVEMLLVMIGLIQQRATVKGRLEIVKLLLKDSRVGRSGSTALLDVASEGHAAVVEVLLNDGRIDPGMHVDRAMVLAALNGHHSVVKLLLADQRVTLARIRMRLLIMLLLKGTL